MFAAGQTVAACNFEYMAQYEINLLILFGLGSGLKQEAVLIDKDFASNFSWQLLAFNHFAEPFFDFEVDVQVFEAWKFIQDPKNWVFGFGVF